MRVKHLYSLATDVRGEVAPRPDLGEMAPTDPKKAYTGVAHELERMPFVLVVPRGFEAARAQSAAKARRSKARGYVDRKPLCASGDAEMIDEREDMHPALKRLLAGRLITCP